MVSQQGIVVEGTPPTFLKVGVYSVEHLFTSRRFDLPWFQRAYAWTEQHAGRLVSDLILAMDGPRGHYWLGHVFLAGQSGQQRVAIVDGHQRSITLTIIVALLRDLLADHNLHARLQAVIGDGGQDGYRLQPQPGVTAFFDAWVQRPDSTLLDPAGDILDLSESERNLLANRDHLRKMLRDLLPETPRRVALAQFILEKCAVTVEWVEDEDEAWALLATAEETGLEFHSSARAKVSLVTAMPREEHEAASHLFEQALAAVGADGMSNLLGHIRTLKVRKRSTKPVERELLERFRLNKSGLAFMREELVPRAQTLVLLNRRSVGEGDAGRICRDALGTLSWVEHQKWVPAALHWLASKGASHAETAQFFSRLDRLTYLLKIGGIDPTEQERRYLALLHDIDTEQPIAAMEQLAIEPPLLAAALENLRSRTFYSKRFHALVLRRISWNISPERDPGPVDGNTVTVEHVLPRKPQRDRAWWQDFPTIEAITEHCNRLGNLAFLSLEENNLAGTNDFMVKRFLLAQAASRFVLAEGAAKYADWNASTILQRTETMIETLFAPWQLPVQA